MATFNVTGGVPRGFAKTDSTPVNGRHTNAGSFASAAVVAREASEQELGSWDSLVTSFPNHRVVHRRCWAESIQASTGAQAVFLVFERRGEIVGCLPGLIRRIGPLRLFGSPLVGWQTCSMGPAFDVGRVTTVELMSAAIALLENRFGVHHIELIGGDLEDAAMRALGFRAEPIPTLRAPLNPGDPGRTLKQLRDSARRNVRRAERLGLVGRIETDESFVDEAYEQMKEVFVRGGNVVPFTHRRVLEFFRHMKDAGTLLAVSVSLPNSDTRIATGLFTIDGRELFLWQWAHRTRHRWYRPTELMTWIAMKAAMDAGCTTFDLMGPGDFKEKFGAEPDLSQYRWVRSRYGWMTHARDVGESSYRWQQAVRGKVLRSLSDWWRREKDASPENRATSDAAGRDE